jgi:hypothetical protein
MVRAGYTPASLAALLKDKGMTLTARSLSNRISRGNFTFAFYVRCMVTMGYDEVHFRLKRPGAPATTPAMGKG